MQMSKEFAVDLGEKYNKVLKLLEDSKFDPPNEPYASKCAAKEILIDMKAKLENTSNNQFSSSSELLKIKAMLGSVYLYLGMTSIEMEELSEGENSLQNCHDTIRDFFNNPQVVMITLNMYNQFGILWSQREPEKAKNYLHKAEQLYHKFKSSDNVAVDISTLFCSNLETQNEENAKQNFEKIHTFTLYYLAQIYGVLKDALKSAIYCHITLQRQLDSGDYDPIDWALNAATLSQFFMEKNGFKQARHHLAASSYIMDEYKEKLFSVSERNEEFDAKVEVFKHRSADIARCWAKYGLVLLSKSKERLLNHTDDISENCSLSADLSKMTLNPDANVSLEELQNLEFTSPKLGHYEKQITDKFVLIMQDAKLVFLNIQGWLQKAESYYTLETLASDHIEIVQDQSNMYFGLLFFEDNVDNQAKLHKRRIDLLENVIQQINPKYYLQYCRQIWFELGQIYSDILNIKCDKLREIEGRPSPHMLAKINHLTEKSIYSFTCFVESFKSDQEEEFVTQIPADFEKAVMQAYFHIGALNNKYITLNKKTQLANIEMSYKAYKKVVDYCKLNEKVIEQMPMEHNICKEMVTLLPVKMAKLAQELH
ncbi:KIF-binding protein isoform X1 [Zophobas morio]|uniref:KIF-binding protein isoform X1 n=1 Tax=Zophobas morio TaxID=2755281 RepID=UPI0030833351